MTLYNGMLLFDVAEDRIGNWRNELGWRGMREVWRLTDGNGNDLPTFIAIDAYEDNEDGEPEDEVWIGNDATGSWEPIGFGSTDQCIEKAKQYMRKHPKG